MAERLLKYYKYISEKKGLTGKMELAKLTKIPSTRASMENDSPENIRIFMDAVNKLTGESAPKF